MNNEIDKLIKEIDKKIKDFESKYNEPTTVEELISQIDKKIQKLEEKMTLKIEISNRCYNGDFGIGSIFENKYSFEVNKHLCISNSVKKFCNNDELSGDILASVNISIPFVLKGNEIKELNNIVNNIRSNSNYMYNENHYKKDTFDFNRYNFIDVQINGKNYEISAKDDEKLLNRLKDLFRINRIDKILKNAINDVISMEEDINEQ